MNCWPSSVFTCGYFAGLTSITPYWLNSTLSPSTRITRSPRILERQPRAAIGEDVGVHRGGGVERRAHARAACRDTTAPCGPATSRPRRLPTAAAPPCWCRCGRRATRTAPWPPRSCAMPRRRRMPATFAGSDFGPTMHEVVVHHVRRPTPEPSATNFSSAGRSCTNTTSASPRRARSSACPVPSATTCTSMPVSLVNAGSR